MNRPLREKEHNILKSLLLGDKTIRELNWILKQKWETTNYNMKKLIEAGYSEKYEEDKIKYYRITDVGKKKIEEYKI